MKNVFKFLGIALLASSLVLVSCGKEEENTNNNGTENNGGGNNGGAEGTIQIALGQTANFTTPQDSTFSYLYNNMANFYASESRACTFDGQYISYYFPVATMAMPTAVGQYDTNSAYMQFDEGNFYALAQQTGNSVFAQFTDWIPNANITANVTAFDANTLTISATMNGAMLNQYEGVYNYVTSPEDDPTTLEEFLADATVENMTITINKIKLQQISK